MEYMQIKCPTNYLHTQRGGVQGISTCPLCSTRKGVCGGGGTGKSS